MVEEVYGWYLCLVFLLSNPGKVFEALPALHVRAVLQIAGKKGLSNSLGGQARWSCWPGGPHGSYIGTIFNPNPKRNPLPPRVVGQRGKRCKCRQNGTASISIPRLCQSTRVSPFIPFFFPFRGGRLASAAGAISCLSWWFGLRLSSDRKLGYLGPWGIWAKLGVPNSRTPPWVDG